VKRVAPLQASRRQLLAGSALVVATTAIARNAGAKDLDLLRLADGATVVLHDHRVPLAAATAQRLAANGARLIELADDPVRMWRDEIGALLARSDTRLLGATRWPEFLMISGLAAESRRRVRYQRLDQASGAIVWLIA
jgi:hypothetical protein